MKVTPLFTSFFLGFAIASSITYAYWAPKPAAAVDSTAANNVQIIEPISMKTLGRERRLRLYLPPNYASSEQRYPVLYMHDAQNLFDAASAYAGEWGVDETLNTLALTHDLQLIVVGIDHGDDKRITELNPFDHDTFGKAEGEAYLDFVVQQLKPWIDQHYRSLPEREHTAIMGSSMGGLISHYAAVRYADIFSKVGVFSPAYWTAPSFTDYLLQHPAQQPQRLFMLMGEAEGGSMMQDFTAMKNTLARIQARQPSLMALSLSVPHAQHNETFWRNQFAPAVLWLFEQPIKQDLANP